MSDLSNGVTMALCSREHVVPFHLQIDSRGYTTPERIVATDEREKDVDESGPCFAGPHHTRPKRRRNERDQDPLPIVQLRIRSAQHACRSVLVNIFDLIRHISICPVRRVDTSPENLKFDAFEIEESKG